MRAYPNHALEVSEETLEDKMALLRDMENEYLTYKKAFKKKHESLVASIKSLKNIITAEVIGGGKTVTIEGMKAEYVPTVVFMKPKKEKEND